VDLFQIFFLHFPLSSAHNAAFHGLAGIRAGVNMAEFHKKRSPDEFLVEVSSDAHRNNTHTAQLGVSLAISRVFPPVFFFNKSFHRAPAGGFKRISTSGTM
jgi:hypothetical protein